MSEENEVKRMGEVPSAMQALASQVDELERTLTILTDHLVPIMASDNTGSEAATPTPSHPVELVDAIQRCSRRVATVTDAMRRVNNRLEL